MSEKRLLSIEEFCNEYCMKRSATFKEIKKGRLKVRTREEGTRKIFITRQDAETWANDLQEVKL